jgi:hypothetical protein
LTQHLVIKDLEEPYILTGFEQELGKSTFSIKPPGNGEIINIIERYEQGIGYGSINYNLSVPPETLVIFHDDDSGEIDYFSIPYHHTLGSQFGFQYKISDAIDGIHPRWKVSKDTVYADSPAVADNHSYMSGTNLNVAFMSLPGVSDDGIIICRDVLNKFTFKLFETRTVEFGNDCFPLNLYGTKDFYKPFPDIGECVREDGVLMMTRQFDEILAPVDLSIEDTMEADYIFDRSIYVRGDEGKIVDIKVISNNISNHRLTEMMCVHANKYRDALIDFYKKILDTYQNILSNSKKLYGDTEVKLSPRFHRLLVQAYVITNKEHPRLKTALQLLHRRSSLNEYRAEFVVEYDVKISRGFKLTDESAGLGVCGV